jgi:amino-acid N-acetyltransferase
MFIYLTLFPPFFLPFPLLPTQDGCCSLVGISLRISWEHGLQEVYLLTETAAEYFLRFGFQLIERSSVSPELHQAVEWTSASPASAYVMVLHLES